MMRIYFNAPSRTRPIRWAVIVVLVVILILLIAGPWKDANPFHRARHHYAGRFYGDGDLYSGSIYGDDDLYGDGGIYGDTCEAEYGRLLKGELGVDVGPYDEHQVGYNDGIPEAWALASTPIRWLQPAGCDYYGPEGPTVSAKGIFKLSLEDHDPLVN